MNSFFRIYGRTFNFRNQTYLISYCVYTAATVELQEMQRGSGSSSRAAAERLATTMKMLESEARQTPGIRRSIDIIKSRMEARESSTQKEREVGQGSASSAEYQMDSLVAPRSDAGSFPESGHHRQVSSNLNSPKLFQDGVVPPGDGLPFNGSSGPVQPQNSSNYSVSMDLEDYPSNWWDVFDASGGFVPDMTNWTWYDTMMLPNPS